MYTLRYIGPEPDCSSQCDFERAEDVFLEVAEHISGSFGDCEMDFDEQVVQDIVTALRGSSYKKLIKAVNAFLYPMNCDYFEVDVWEPKAEPSKGSYGERMDKVFASVDKARNEWQKWKNEGQVQGG